MATLVVCVSYVKNLCSGGPAESGNTKDLKKQNSQLKEVIKEMRSEMEMLSQQITSNTSTPNKMKEEKSSKTLFVYVYYKMHVSCVV